MSKMSLLVVTETMEGNFTDNTFELVGLGKDLSQALGVELLTLAIGNNLNGKFSELGDSDEVIYIEDERLENYIPDYWKQIIEGVAKKRKPRLILIPYTSIGMDLSAKVANSLNATHIGYCQSVDVSNGNSVTSLLFGGKILLNSILGEETTVLAVNSGVSFSSDVKMSGSPKISKEVAEEYISTSKIRFKALHAPDTSDIDIAASDVLVSIGRGIEDESNIELAEELADALGAAVSASRPIIDQGWLPKTRQVGKSGKIVKPKLYFAFGISGAPEHVEGMRDAETIIAVNIDETAPIFGIAQYGIVGDLFDIIPELTEAVEEKKG